MERAERSMDRVAAAAAAVCAFGGERAASLGGGVCTRHSGAAVAGRKALQAELEATQQKLQHAWAESERLGALQETFTHLLYRAINNRMILGQQVSQTAVSEIGTDGVATRVKHGQWAHKQGTRWGRKER